MSSIKDCVKIRPHHLLCTQGFSGKGYNDEFTSNMSDITSHLRNTPKACIRIVFSTDEICEECPNMLDVNLCKDDEKVKRFDKKVIEYFGIEEKEYIYNHIVSEINSKMTASTMDDICGDCPWYPVSACKNNIMG